MRSKLPRLLVLLSVLLFVVLHSIAAFKFPGGNVFDTQASGHSFWLNYLCDLTHTTALNGEPNPSAPIAKASMLVLSVGLAAFFWLAASRLMAPCSSKVRRPPGRLRRRGGWRRARSGSTSTTAPVAPHRSTRRSSTCCATIERREGGAEGAPAG